MAKSPAKKTLNKKKNDGNKEFVWSDDEAELLLNVSIEYKVVKAAESHRLGICQEQV